MSLTIRTRASDTVADAVARALGPEWTLSHETEPADWFRTVQHRDGYRISLGWYQDRIQITGAWPVDSEKQSYRPYSGSPEITVGAEKEPAKIAADIRRRFLPPYLALWTKQAERVKQANAQHEKTRASIAALVAAGCRAADTNGGRNGTVYAQHSHSYTMSANGESIRFEAFSCPLPIALELVDLLDEQTGLSRVQGRQVIDSIVDLLYDGARGDWRELHSCADTIQEITLLLGPIVERRAAAFEAHRAADPHCSCADCLAWLEAHTEIEAEA